MTDEERFFAWLDGELPPDEAAAVEARVTADAELQRLAQQHRALGSRLKSAFAPIATEPVPEHLASATRASAEIVDLASARQSRVRPAYRTWGALAATLAIGIGLGTLMPRESPSVATANGKLIAGGALGQALDVQLASAPVGDTRIGLTFRNEAGQICRSFTDRGASGLACRGDGRWQLKGLFAAPEAQTGSYRMAAGMDPNLAALVDSTMTGEAFDARAEKAARDKHWR